MTMPICPACANRGTVTERLDQADVLRVFDCPRGCPAPAQIDAEERAARRRAELEDYWRLCDEYDAAGPELLEDAA